MTKCSLLRFLMESSGGVIYKWLYCAECPHGPFKCYLIMKFHLLFARAFMHLSWGHANSRAISRLPFYRSPLIWKALRTFSPHFSINHSFSGANCRLWKTRERQNVIVVHCCRAFCGLVRQSGVNATPSDIKKGPNWGACSVLLGFMSFVTLYMNERTKKKQNNTCGETAWMF